MFHPLSSDSILFVRADWRCLSLFVAVAVVPLVPRLSCCLVERKGNRMHYNWRTLRIRPGGTALLLPPHLQLQLSCMRFFGNNNNNNNQLNFILYSRGRPQQFVMNNSTVERAERKIIYAALDSTKWKIESTFPPSLAAESRPQFAVLCFLSVCLFSFFPLKS